MRPLLAVIVIPSITYYNSCMIYFSNFKGKKVYTEDQICIGKLDDLIFLASERPNISKLVVKGKLNDKIIIPTSCLRKINSTILITKDFNTVELQENELYILKNLLDKQIIDLTGNKIVRVNDVAIQDRDGLYIAGVDIGILGILRWLKLENLFFKLVSIFRMKPTSQFLSWGEIQPLELARGQVKLRKEEKRLEKLRPADLADHLEKTNILNVRRFLKILDEKFAADVITNLNINYQIALFRQFSDEKAAKIIMLIDPDEAVDVLLALPAKKRDEIIKSLPEDKKRKIAYLLSLAKTPIGNFVTTEYLTVSPDNTVREVFDLIKKNSSDIPVLNYVYVINKERQLIGVFNLHELLLQDLDNLIYKFMIQNVIIIHLTTPEEIVIKKMLKYKIYSLPVIDKDKHLVGIISVDDIAESIIPKIK